MTWVVFVLARQCLNHPVSGNGSLSPMRPPHLRPPHLGSVRGTLFRTAPAAIEPCAHSRTRALPLFCARLIQLLRINPPTASRRLFWEVIRWKGEPNTPLAILSPQNGNLHGRSEWTWIMNELEGNWYWTKFWRQRVVKPKWNWEWRVPRAPMWPMSEKGLELIERVRNVGAEQRHQSEGHYNQILQ